MNVIPFADYGEGRVGVEYDFYNKNVTIKANGYDMVEFVVPLSLWQMPQKNREYRTDRDAGPIELKVGADENEMTDTVRQEAGSEPNRTHEFYDKFWGQFFALCPGRS